MASISQGILAALLTGMDLSPAIAEMALRSYVLPPVKKIILKL